MSRVILLNKPYGVLSQFTDAAGRPTLKDCISIPGVYAAGRLDADSEGLVLLTDDGGFQARISHPKYKLDKRYWAQVEGLPDALSLEAMMRGLDLGDFTTLPCRAKVIAEPDALWPRCPPIRYRAAIPTTWLEITLREGKNRQVRRMTARVGYPTLRLIRFSIGNWTLSGLLPGEWREESFENSCQPVKGRRVTRHDARVQPVVSQPSQRLHRKDSK